MLNLSSKEDSLLKQILWLEDYSKQKGFEWKITNSVLLKKSKIYTDESDLERDLNSLKDKGFITIINGIVKSKVDTGEVEEEVEIEKKEFKTLKTIYRERITYLKMTNKLERVKKWEEWSGFNFYNNVSIKDMIDYINSEEDELLKEEEDKILELARDTDKLKDIIENKQQEFRYLDTRNKWTVKKYLEDVYNLIDKVLPNDEDIKKKYYTYLERVIDCEKNNTPYTYSNDGLTIKDKILYLIGDLKEEEMEQLDIESINNKIDNINIRTDIKEELKELALAVDKIRQNNNKKISFFY